MYCPTTRREFLEFSRNWPNHAAECPVQDLFLVCAVLDVPGRPESLLDRDDIRIFGMPWYFSEHINEVNIFPKVDARRRYEERQLKETTP